MCESILISHQQPLCPDLARECFNQSNGRIQDLFLGRGFAPLTTTVIINNKGIRKRLKRLVRKELFTKRMSTSRLGIDLSKSVTEALLAPASSSSSVAKIQGRIRQSKKTLTKTMIHKVMPNKGGYVIKTTSNDDQATQPLSEKELIACLNKSDKQQVLEYVGKLVEIQRIRRSWRLSPTGFYETRHRFHNMKDDGTNADHYNNNGDSPLPRSHSLFSTEDDAEYTILPTNIQRDQLKCGVSVTTWADTLPKQIRDMPVSSMVQCTLQSQSKSLPCEEVLEEYFEEKRSSDFEKYLKTLRWERPQNPRKTPWWKSRVREDKKRKAALIQQHGSNASSEEVFSSSELDYLTFLATSKKDISRLAPATWWRARPGALENFFKSVSVAEAEFLKTRRENKTLVGRDFSIELFAENSHIHLDTGERVHVPHALLTMEWCTLPADPDLQFDKYNELQAAVENGTLLKHLEKFLKILRECGFYNGPIDNTQEGEGEFEMPDFSSMPSRVLWKIYDLFYRTNISLVQRTRCVKIYLKEREVFAAVKTSSPDAIIWETGDAAFSAEGRVLVDLLTFWNADAVQLWKHVIGCVKSRCFFCHRPLSRLDSQETGWGPVCESKFSIMLQELRNKVGHVVNRQPSALVTGIAVQSNPKPAVLFPAHHCRDGARVQVPFDLIKAYPILRFLEEEGMINDEENWDAVLKMLPIKVTQEIIDSLTAFETSPVLYVPTSLVEVLHLLDFFSSCKLEPLCFLIGSLL